MIHSYERNIWTAGQNDETAQLIMRHDYNFDCACCYLNQAHTERLHNELLEEEKKRKKISQTY